MLFQVCYQTVKRESVLCYSIANNTPSIQSLFETCAQKCKHYAHFITQISERNTSLSQGW